MGLTLQGEMWNRPTDAIAFHAFYSDVDRAWTWKVRVRYSGLSWEESDSWQGTETTPEDAYEQIARVLGGLLLA